MLPSTSSVAASASCFFPISPRLSANVSAFSSPAAAPLSSPGEKRNNPSSAPPRASSSSAFPFRRLLDQLTTEQRAQARDESLLAVKKFWDGREINLPLEIVIGSGIRP